MPQDFHQHELGTPASDIVRRESVSDSVECSWWWVKLQAPAENLEVPQYDAPVKFATVERGEYGIVPVVAAPAKKDFPQFVGEGNHPLFIALAGNGQKEVFEIDLRPVKPERFFNSEAGIEKRQHEGMEPFVIER